MAMRNGLERTATMGCKGRLGRRSLAANGDLTGVHWLQMEISQAFIGCKGDSTGVYWLQREIRQA